jgi:hypothetical protein
MFHRPLHLLTSTCTRRVEVSQTRTPTLPVILAPRRAGNASKSPHTRATKVNSEHRTVSENSSANAQRMRATNLPCHRHPQAQESTNQNSQDRGWLTTSKLTTRDPVNKGWHTSPASCEPRRRSRRSEETAYGGSGRSARRASNATRGRGRRGWRRRGGRGSPVRRRRTPNGLNLKRIIIWRLGVPSCIEGRLGVSLWVFPLLRSC